MAIVFDVYGTLLDVHSAAARNRALLGERTEAVSQLWRTRQLEYAWTATLTGDYRDFWTLTGRALDTALALAGVRDRDGVRAPLLEAYTALDPYEDVLPVLAALRDRGETLAVLSNGSPDMLARALGHAGLTAHFDAILSVDPARVYKPHPEAYRRAAAHLALAPSTIRFVSSNAWDAAGAARFGFEACWINRAGGPPEYPDHGAVRAVTGLRDLI